MKVKLSIERERIVLRSPWRPDLQLKCKSVAGWYWSEPKKAWTFPLSMESLRSLRSQFGNDLAPEAGVMRWATAARDRELALKRLSRRDDTRLRILPERAPELNLAMAQRTYQRVGAKFGAVGGSVLFADEPGLGKTAMTLASLIEGETYDGTHLIIAPKVSLESVWGRQIKMWTPDGQYVAMPEGKAKRQKALEEFWTLDEPRFLVVNLAMVRRKYGQFCKKCDHWGKGYRGREGFPGEHYAADHKTAKTVFSEDWPEILNVAWDTAILDESHAALAAYTPANVSQTTAGLLDLKTTNRIALTGTPLRGEERNIWGTLDWLGVKTGGYWAFCEEYFEVANNGFAKVVYGLDPDRTDAFYRLLDARVLRRTRAEVRPDLPIGQRFDVMVEMGPKHKKQYDEFAEMGEVKLKTGLVSGLGTLSELTRLRQFAWGVWDDPNRDGSLIPTLDSPKLEYIIQFLEERGITDPKRSWLPEKGSAYKIVIASQFTQIIRLLEDHLNNTLKIPTLAITGAESQDAKNKAQAIFQSTDTRFRVMLINTQAGGASIELDAWCDEMLVDDETFIADDQVQLEGRINNRSGRVAPRSWYYLRTADTIDQKVAEGNYEQHTLQHQLLDGRRGVNLALHLTARAE